MELQDWKLSELGEDIWKKKYQRNGESFEQWLERVSGGDLDVIQLIVDKKFLFGGRILSNRGITNRGVTYSNCYVIAPPEDSIEGIYITAMKLARTFSYGGGCGVDISTLRPKGAEVHNAALTTSGAVSFMDVLEQTARVIGQNGRRGALMISMDSSHPDIHDFIDAKLDNKLEKCNISVRMSAKDMEDKPEILDHIAANNYDWAEPGILYWDTIESYNLLDEFKDFKYAGVNPCAEEPLPAGGSCLLGALNLSEFVENPFTPQAAFNIPEFKHAVRIAIRALNNVLDEGLKLHPLDEQILTVNDWRQIGLGIMGFADMLLKMGCQYDSARALNIIDMVGKTLVNTGLEESALLAMDTESFPKCENKKLLASTFIQVLKNSNVIEENTINLIRQHGLRNSQLFTIAPTGSISTMLGVSGGVEPIFATHYTRKTESLHGEDVFYKVYTPIIQKMIDMQLIHEENVGNIATAQNIDPFDRVTIQATWQKYIDASISSTVNVTNDTDVATIRDLYQAAWEEGCKGLTIYRAGCKKEGVLVVDTPKEQTTENTIHIPITDTSIDNCVAYGTQLTTGCGSLWMSVYFHKKTGQLCHIFLDKGSQGGCNSFMVGLSRMISYAGKLGGTVEGICDQLNSVPACPSYTVRNAVKGDTSSGKCCPSAIGRALMELKRRYIADHEELYKEELKPEEVKVSNCPECGAKLNFTGGCNSCPECGYTKCD
jgi:ribonucleoside-diphosphate reductase alpha chain|nr:MAG TPA: ribonucleoside-diphosphate reductase, adenosylcobalamin-dependent [Caudoviricetes sp.]